MSFYRAIFFYFFLFIIIRLMGKREIGALAPIDLVVTIILAELAVIPIENPTVPIMVGVVPIITIFFLEMGLTSLSLRSRVWRRLINGRPSILVKDGKLMPDQMRRERYTIDDLLEQLRRKGLPNIAEVEVAILETDGFLSAIPKSQHRPIQPSDLNLSTAYEGLPLSIIIDGEVDYANLNKCGLDMTWLKEQLKNLGVHDVKDVFSAILDTRGELFVQRQGDYKFYMK